MRRLIKHFLNTKTQRHEVAIAAGKISQSKYRKAIIAEGKYHEVAIAKGKYRAANIAVGKYHEVNIALQISP